MFKLGGTNFQKFTAACLLATFIGVQVLVPIRSAEATDFGGAWAQFTQFNLKEWVLDPIANALVVSLIQASANTMINWINGQGAGFVPNLEQALRREADRVGGEFINQLSGVNLCGNIGSYLRFSLRSPSLRQELECTATEIVENVEDFYRDFDRGGWPAFLKIAFEPQNNPYGAYFLAYDAKIAAESSALNARRAEFQIGRGFLGVRRSVQRCEDFTDESTGTPSQICRTEYVTQTPGSLAADALSKASFLGLDKALLADEINEAITGVAMAFVNRFVTRPIFTRSNNNIEATDQGYGTGQERIQAYVEEFCTIEDKMSVKPAREFIQNTLPALYDMFPPQGKFLTQSYCHTQFFNKKNAVPMGRCIQACYQKTAELAKQEIARSRDQRRQPPSWARYLAEFSTGTSLIGADHINPATGTWWDFGGLGGGPSEEEEEEEEEKDKKKNEVCATQEEIERFLRENPGDEGRLSSAFPC